MIRLRLRRMGAKKRPSYRIVAADSKSPRDGRFIESFGIYDPITDPATIRIDEDRARHWLSVGAQPSDTVRDIFRRAGLIGQQVAATPEASEAPPEEATAEEPKPRRRRKPTVEAEAAPDEAPAETAKPRQRRKPTAEAETTPAATA